MSKKCIHCGEELEDAALFCPNCGTPQKAKEAAAAPAAAGGAFSLESLLQKKQQDYASVQQKAIDEERKRLEEEAKRKAEEEARQAEEERLRREEEERKKAEEKARREEAKRKKAEAERLKREEEERRQAEEQARKEEEERLRREEEERKKAEAKAKREEARRKKEEAEAEAKARKEEPKLKKEQKAAAPAEKKAKREVRKKPEEDNLPYVDLGLSVKWAKCNLGASNPGETGTCYAWGETKPKSDDTWKTYQFGKEKPFSKYQPKMNVVVKHLFKADENLVKGDDKAVLDLCDDAANVKLGGNWRIPTAKEVSELIRNCTWTTAIVNGVKGFKVKSDKKGYTDKWIFLPHCGSNGMHTSYWTSSLDPKDPAFAKKLSIIMKWAWEGDVLSNLELSVSQMIRCAKAVIRPVVK